MQSTALTVYVEKPDGIRTPLPDRLSSVLLNRFDFSRPLTLSCWADRGRLMRVLEAGTGGARAEVTELVRTLELEGEITLYRA